MYRKYIDDKKSLMCEFCNRYIFKDVENSEDDYVNYKLIQLEKNKRYYIKCKECGPKFHKTFKELVNRQLTGEMKTHIITPTLEINIKAICSKNYDYEYNL